MNRPVLLKQKKRRNSPAVERANKEIAKELAKQERIIYSATATVLWTEYGWRKQRIMKRFQTSAEAWHECAEAGVELSMLQMLENETGIELRLNGYEKSYHELAYLDAGAWDKNPPSVVQVVAIRQQMKKWIAPQLLACICLGLHRNDGFGPERLATFINHVNALRDEYGEKSYKPYAEYMESVTEMKMEDLT